jgi:hypothetical protein
MGIDICGGPSFNWAGWRYLYDAGKAFGWEPAGTSKPVPWTDEHGTPIEGDWDEEALGAWPGSYFSNAGQVVTDEDAAAWRAAIQKAMSCVAGDAVPETPDQQKAVDEAGEGAVMLFEAFIEASQTRMILE